MIKVSNKMKMTEKGYALYMNGKLNLGSLVGQGGEFAIKILKKSDKFVTMQFMLLSVNQTIIAKKIYNVKKGETIKFDGEIRIEIPPYRPSVRKTKNRRDGGLNEHQNHP